MFVNPADFHSGRNASRAREMTHGGPATALAKTCIAGGSRGPLRPSQHRGARGRDAARQAAQRRPRDREDDRQGQVGRFEGAGATSFRRAGAWMARLARRRTRPMPCSTADRASASAGSARRRSSAHRRCTCSKIRPKCFESCNHIRAELGKTRREQDPKD